METVFQEYIHVHKEGVFVINELNNTKNDCAQSEETAAAAESQAAPVQDNGASVTPDTEKTGNADRISSQTEPERGYREQGHQEQESPYREDFRENLNMDEERHSQKRFWRFRTKNDEESRDQLILSRIRDEELMEYLALEQRRLEFLQHAKEEKEKRIMDAFQLVAVLAATVALTYLLRDNPTILISILYVAGIVAAIKVWKNPK